MPSTLSGLLVAIYTLIPGYFYYAVRRSVAPTRRVSTLVEAANVIVVAMITNTISLAFYGILQAVPWIRNHSPSIVDLIRDPSGYLLHSNSRLAYVGVWAIALLILSTILAVIFAYRVQKMIRRSTERIFETTRITDESVWDHFFSAVAPDDCVIYVECYMQDGSYAAGSLSWYNTDIDDTPDRDIALVRPLVLTSVSGTDLMEPGYDQVMIISARDIRQIVVTYIARDAIDAELERRSDIDPDSEGLDN